MASLQAVREASAIESSLPVGSEAWLPPANTSPVYSATTQCGSHEQPPRRNMNASPTNRLTLGDLTVVLAVVLLCYGLAELKRRTSFLDGVLRGDGSQALGYETRNVAEALRSGRGFSDPFGIATGATAWKAPAVPSVFAGLMWLFSDDRAAVVEAVLLLHALAVFSTGAMVVWLARCHGVAWLGSGVFACACVLDFHYLFQHAYDTWLFLPLVNVAWLLGACWRPGASLGKWVGWALFGGVTTLAGPICGVAWLCSTARALWIEGQHFGWPLAGRRACLLFFVVLLCMMPWTIRNRLVLGSWIPTKSNLMYELWQSQCLGEDGLIDIGMQLQHPYSARGEQRQDYVQLGEMGFVAKYGQLAKQAIADQPLEFLRRVGHRLAAATLVYRPNRLSIRNLPYGMIVSVLLPVFTLAVALCPLTQVLDQRARFLTITYGLALLPYVLVSYYDRYSAPLMGLKAVAMVFAVRWLFGASTKEPAERPG